MRVLVVSASPRVPSDSRPLAERATGILRALPGVEASLLDLATAGVEPFRGFEEAYGPATTEAVDRLRRADACILVTPVYNGTYTSALKNLFEHVHSKEIAGKVAGFAIVGGGPKGFLFVHAALSALMSYFRILHAPRAVFAQTADLEEGIPPALERRLASLVADVLALTRATAPRAPA